MKLIKNRRGTAEVIGTLLAIIILIFFFTNVYLWHDAATRDANQVYLEKINSTFTIALRTNVIEVIAGGSDIALSGLWINDDSTNMHYYADLNNAPVAAGASFNITLITSPDTIVKTENGGVSVGYPPSPGVSVECTVINTLGVAESTTFTYGKIVS